jgi:hypothetical protein
MSDGGIGAEHGNVTYFATINITGDLSKEQLRAVVKRLKDTMKLKVTTGGAIGQDGSPINGVVVNAARVSDGKALKEGSPVPMTFSVKAEKST